MDMLLPAAGPPGAVPGLAEASARRVSLFLQAGGRAVVLVDPSAPARGAALDSILAALPAGAIRLGNPLASALTLHRLLFQLGIEDEDGDPGGSIVCALEVPSGARMAVLAVDDAHSLTAEAMAALARVPNAASADQAGRLLLLAGGPGLLGLLGGPGCDALREAKLTLTVVAPGVVESGVVEAGVAAPSNGVPCPCEPGAAISFREPGVAVGPPSRSGITRRWWTGLLLAGSFLVGLIGTPLLFWATQAPAGLPLGAPAGDSALPAVAPPGSGIAGTGSAYFAPKPAPDTPEPRITPRPQPMRTLDDARLRRDFDAFLNRAGRDTAGLSARARRRLFREYLDWRTRTAEQPGAQKPFAPGVP